MPRRKPPRLSATLHLRPAQPSCCPRRPASERVRGGGVRSSLASTPLLYPARPQRPPHHGAETQRLCLTQGRTAKYWLPVCYSLYASRLIFSPFPVSSNCPALPACSPPRPDPRRRHSEVRGWSHHKPATASGSRLHTLPPAPVPASAGAVTTPATEGCGRATAL